MRFFFALYLNKDFSFLLTRLFIVFVLFMNPTKSISFQGEGGDDGRNGTSGPPGPKVKEITY